MRFGLFYQASEADGQTHIERYAEMLDLIALGDTLGFDVAWLAELHFGGAFSLLASPLMVVPVIAQRTQRIRIGTAVTLLPLHHPLSCAEQAATADLLSGGRLEFAVGRGSIPSQFHGFRVAVSENRARRDARRRAEVLQEHRNDLRAAPGLLRRPPAAPEDDPGDHRQSPVREVLPRPGRLRRRGRGRRSAPGGARRIRALADHLLVRSRLDAAAGGSRARDAAVHRRGHAEVPLEKARFGTKEDRVAKSVVTPERFARGMTFEEYVKYAETPENLAREGFGSYFPDGGSIGAVRKDQSAVFRERYARARLTDQQIGAIKWLAAHPDGPAKILVISEDWSSDCRRDVPMLARLAEAGGLELRIFNRDGKKILGTRRPDPAAYPDGNHDLMLEFLNKKNGAEWASLLVAVFYTKDFQELHRYIEYPAIYRKDLIRGHQQSARPGETEEQARDRDRREFLAMQQSPFFDVWASAGIDEILSALYEKLTVTR